MARPPPDSEDDAALVARVGAGDAAAYRELVVRHAEKLHHYALRLTRNPSEAEDIVQETFVRLYQGAADYSPKARVTTWLHRIAHNLAVDRLRARGRWSPLGDEDEVAAPALQAELLDDKRQAEDVAAALSTLPDRQRAALSLVYLQELSGAEAAEILGVGPEALESLLARARRALRARLGDAAGRPGA